MGRKLTICLRLPFSDRSTGSDWVRVGRRNTGADTVKRTKSQSGLDLHVDIFVLL